MNEELEQHRPGLWGLAYRMLGSAADADDAVQETLLRALERPPADLDRPLGPWLGRVLVNHCRDRLRERRRRSYVGEWLPSPVPSAPGDVLGGHPWDEGARVPSPAARYDLAESVSYAFLIALEALTPTQRAVLVLRDVMDRSVAETAEVLGLGEANVKTTLHRARRAMAAYDRRRVTPPPAVAGGRVAEMLGRLVAALAAADAASLIALLEEDAVLIADGGGHVAAARRPIVGPERIARLYLTLLEHLGPPERVELVDLNGRPALLHATTRVPRAHAARGVILIELGTDGRIAEIRSVLAPDKLVAIGRARPWQLQPG